MSPNAPAANAAFEAATQIKPLGAGQYEVNLRDEWCVGAGELYHKISILHIYIYIYILTKQSPTAATQPRYSTA